MATHKIGQIIILVRFKPRPFSKDMKVKVLACAMVTMSPLSSRLSAGEVVPSELPAKQTATPENGKAQIIETESASISGGSTSEGAGRIWVDSRELSDAERRNGLRFDRGWFLFGQLGGGFWRGRYLTRQSPGSGFGGGTPEVDAVYSANAGIGRFMTPDWSVEFNFSASVGIKNAQGKITSGMANPPNSGTRVSSNSFYHIRNRFYLYDFDPERRLFAFFGAGVTQFNDAYYLPDQPRVFVPDAKATVFAPSISGGAGVTLFDASYARFYFEAGYYHTFSVDRLDSNQISTLGIGFSFPLDARVYSEDDVQTLSPGPSSPEKQAFILENDQLAPVMPAMNHPKTITSEELRLIAYQQAAQGPPIPRDALEPPSRNGLDFAVDTMLLSGMLMGFKRALNVTSARGLLKGGYQLWPHNVSQVPPIPDGNRFYTNFVLHPYVGALYYMYYRDRGYSRVASGVGSFLVSAVHEFLIEAVYEPPSGVDIIATPGFGVPLGILMDETSVEWARSDSTLKKIAAHFINPMIGMPFARFRRGPYYNPENDKVFTLQWNWRFSSGDGSIFK